jgi:pimeloyl-ACP methyl ester carboxylesterase
MTSRERASEHCLVHGAWADGSPWRAVIQSLQAKGYIVTAPQFPETSLADDVARLRQVLARQNGPRILAGHSYGGQVMTSLGADEPNVPPAGLPQLQSEVVVALVYIAAFGLDEGESLDERVSIREDLCQELKMVGWRAGWATT